MGYDIPDKVRYKEKIVVGLDGKQLIYALVFGFVALLAYGLPLEGELKLVLPSFIAIAGLGFIFLGLEDQLLERYSYFRASRLKKDLAKFSARINPVERIENGCLVLSNGELRAVIQVSPLNFALFDDDRKKALISNYRDFLNHLNYPVQIVVRTKRASLDSYFENQEKELKGGLEELYADFKTHELGFLLENSVNEREYYLVVCLRPEPKKLAEAFIKLGERTQIIREKLADCGIESNRLEDGKLEPFSASYFVVEG